MGTNLSFDFSDQWIRPTAKFIILIFCSLALMIADGQFSLLNGVRSTLLSVIGPIQSVANIPVKTYDNLSIFFQSQSQLQEENKQLTFENAQLKAQMTAQTALKKDMEQLERINHLRQNTLSVITAAEIVTTNNNLFSTQLNISKGSNDGVEPGQIVIDSSGLLGQVTSVAPTHSEIAPLTNSKQIIPVMVERTGDRALLYGTGDGVELRYLSGSVPLQPKDRLVTSGLDDVYTPGIPVALIVQAQKNTAGAFFRVEAIPVANINKSRYVLVLARKTPIDNINTAPQTASDTPAPITTSSERP